MIPPIEAELGLIRQQSEANKTELVSRFDGLEALIRNLIPPAYAHLPLVPHTAAQAQGPEQMDIESTATRARQAETKDTQPPKKFKSATRIPSLTVK